MEEVRAQSVDETDEVTGAAVPDADGSVRALEAILFVAAEPLSSTVLAQLLETDRASVERLLEGLAADYERRGAGIALRRVAGGWRLATSPATAPVVERFVLSSRHARLTRAALETLAIVAYKQPVTRHQISGIRGVNSDGVLRALVDRGLVAEVGRDDGPGRPSLFGTTPEFLERLGLDSVGDLPSLAPLLGDEPHAGPPRAEQDPAVVGDESGEPEREDPGDPGPDVPGGPSETDDVEPGAPAGPGPETGEEPEESPGPGAPDPDPGRRDERSGDPGPDG